MLFELCPNARGYSIVKFDDQLGWLEVDWVVGGSFQQRQCRVNNVFLAILALP
jgi:hypothetical protein